MGSIVCVLGNWAKYGGIKRRVDNSRLGLQLTPGRIMMLFTCHCCRHLIIIFAIIIIITPSTFALIPTLIGFFILAHGIMVQQRGSIRKAKVVSTELGG